MENKTTTYRDKNAEPPGPWYTEFWAWFVFTPLIFVVFASTAMAIIAFSTNDDRVNDDYYKVGKLINATFDANQKSKDLQLRSRIRFDWVSGEVFVNIDVKQGEQYDMLDNTNQLVLHFSHPAQSGKDRTIFLQMLERGIWRGDISEAFDGRWYLRLSELNKNDDEVWRMYGEASLPSNVSISLQ